MYYQHVVESVKHRWCTGVAQGQSEPIRGSGPQHQFSKVDETRGCMVCTWEEPRPAAPSTDGYLGLPLHVALTRSTYTVLWPATYVGCERKQLMLPGTHALAQGCPGWQQLAAVLLVRSPRCDTLADVKPLSRADIKAPPPLPMVSAPPASSQPQSPHSTLTAAHGGCKLPGQPRQQPPAFPTSHAHPGSWTGMPPM
jgi:hypothetical protein